MNPVVMFSGGIASYVAARRVVDEGRDPVLLFTDTRIEDADLYRFLTDAETDLGVEVTRIADGRTPWEVFAAERFLGNSRADPCSKILKRKLARRWVDDNCEPDTPVVFGLSWDEAHRHPRVAAAWAPHPVEFPLLDPPLLFRDQMLATARDRGLEPPRLYDLGFSHNNCGGGCVKMGQGGFAHLLRTLPEVYAEWETEEERLRVQLGDVSILADQKGGPKRPLTLRVLRERIAEGGDQIDLFDVGGCGCMAEG
jgi:hypothetical protein